MILSVVSESIKEGQSQRKAEKEKSKEGEKLQLMLMLISMLNKNFLIYIKEPVSLLAGFFI